MGTFEVSYQDTPSTKNSQSRSFIRGHILSNNNNTSFNITIEQCVETSNNTDGIGHKYNVSYPFDRVFTELKITKLD
jgi:hypothetical protein